MTIPAKFPPGKNSWTDCANVPLYGLVGALQALASQLRTLDGQLKLLPSQVSEVYECGRRGLHTRGVIAGRLIDRLVGLSAQQGQVARAATLVTLTSTWVPRPREMTDLEATAATKATKAHRLSRKLGILKATLDESDEMFGLTVEERREQCSDLEADIIGAEKLLQEAERAFAVAQLLYYEKHPST